MAGFALLMGAIAAADPPATVYAAGDVVSYGRHLSVTENYRQSNVDCNMNSAAWFAFTRTSATLVPPNSVVEPNHPQRQGTPSYCGVFEWAMHTFNWLTSSKEARGPGLIGEDLVFASPIFFELVPTGKGRYDLVQNQPGRVPKLKVRALKAVVAREDVQTSGAVLMAQPRKGQKYGSLVYYQIAVNDVYAYFLTALANHWPLPKDAHGTVPFPTTDADVDALKRFAKENRLRFAEFAGRSDESALAIELKTSWVEADSVPSDCSMPYITRTATIPTYDTRNPRKWVVNGEKTTKLALIGMHVVGSAGGHPEMIWTTFEHWCNAPNPAYKVMAGVNCALTACDDYSQFDRFGLELPPDSGAGWLLSSPVGSDRLRFNQERMKLSGTDIVASGKLDIGPSDTLRWAPFGSAPDMVDLNSQLFNVNVIRVRNLGGETSYAMIGAIWTENGLSPHPAASRGYNLLGTVSLANSSMETYLQGNGKNCFACHTGTPGRPPGTSMSHVFAYVNPLPIHTATAGKNTGPASPSPSDGAAPASSSAGPATGGATTGRLVQSAPNTRGGLACTYQLNGETYIRNTKKTTCPATTAAPESVRAGAPVAAGAGTVAAGAGVLVHSATNPNGRLECTYQLGEQAFKRKTRNAQCPQTATPPANPAGSGGATAATAATAASSAPATAALIRSERDANGSLACTYKSGQQTFERHTQRAHCPPTAEPPRAKTGAR
jgi:hypothetical protein